MGHVAVAVDVRGVDPGSPAQRRHQLFQRRQLFGCRRALLEIPDQADSDAVLVEEIVPPPDAEVAAGVGLAMRARELRLPARSHVHASVLRIAPVTDHEVVAQTVRPVPHVPVVAVHPGRCRDRAGRMMHHDDLPLATFDPPGWYQYSLVEVHGSIVSWSRRRRHRSAWRGHHPRHRPGYRRDHAMRRTPRRQQRFR